eukprot:EG_transcript_6253
MLFRYQQQPSALVQGAWGTPRVQRGTFPCTATFSSTVIVQAKRVALTGPPIKFQDSGQYDFIKHSLPPEQGQLSTADSPNRKRDKARVESRWRLPEPRTIQCSGQG